MKKLIVFMAVGLFSATLFSCSETGMEKESYIKPEQVVVNSFDTWLETNFIAPYNIQFKYRYEDMESDMKYNLSPAYFDKSQELAVLVRHLCLESYDELTGNRAFITNYFPKILFIIGSPAYNNNGSIILGTAEGGRKIALYNVNVLDSRQMSPAQLNELYFKTIHHEFAHILNQTKPYSTDFKAIVPNITQATGIKYVGNQCFTVYPNEQKALQDGFISPYSATDDGEDFVELIAIYITNTAAAWEAKLQTAGNVNKKNGRALIETKFDIVKTYMKGDWGIDLDDLRTIVLRRQNEISNLDFNL